MSGESIPDRVTITEMELALINAKLSEMHVDIEVLKQDATLIKAILGETTEAVGRVESTLDRHGERFDSIDRTLAEILRRLPEAS